MFIGEQVLKLRKTLKLSQKEFGDSLGISQKHVSQIEKNTREPSEQLIKHLCLYFYTSENWIKTGAGEMLTSPEGVLKNIMARFGEQTIIEALDSIKLLKEKGDKITSIDSIDTAARRLSDKEPELRRMINTLHTIFSLNDERLKTWASYQFDRAFPADVVEDAQKKQQETDRQSSAG